MDPLSVLKTLWTYKFWVLPVILLTVAAGTYVYEFGPRSYESKMSIAIVNPTLPSERELEKNPALAKLNKDNPYLRSSDPSLVTDVMVSQLTSGTTAEKIKNAGLGPDYDVGLGVNSNGFVIDITGVGNTPEKASATAEALGKNLEQNLHDAQKVNGADDLYLFTPLVVVQPQKPTEQFSSRLRSLIVVIIAGGILILASVSAATAATRARDKRRSRRTPKDSDSDVTPIGPLERQSPKVISGGPELLENSALPQTEIPFLTVNRLKA